MVAKRTSVVGCMALVALALSITAGACSSGGSAHIEPAQATKATAPPTTADPQAADKAAVLAAYQGYWDTLHRAEGLPDGQPHQLAELGDYAYEKALDAAVNAVQRLIENHRTVRGVITGTDPEVVCLNDARAVIKNHYVDAVDAFDSNGQPVRSGASQPGPADTNELSIVIKRPTDGRWAVAERYISTAGAMPTQDQLCRA